MCSGVQAVAERQVRANLVHWQSLGRGPDELAVALRSSLPLITSLLYNPPVNNVASLIVGQCQPELLFFPIHRFPWTLQCQCEQLRDNHLCLLGALLLLVISLRQC